MSLLQFSLFEGKSDLDGNGRPISSFEYDLFNNVHTDLENKDLVIEERVLTGLVLTGIDSYEEAYLKVCLILGLNLI